MVQGSKKSRQRTPENFFGHPKPDSDPLSIKAARLTMLSVSYLSVSQEPMFYKFHKKSWRRPIFPGHIVQVSSAWKSLTAEFGMGSGVPPLLSPPTFVFVDVKVSVVKNLKKSWHKSRPLPDGRSRE